MDISESLVQQLNCMQLHEKHDMVMRLLAVLKEHQCDDGVDADYARHLLEVFGWNLGDAVDAYFSVNGEHSPLPAMTLLRQVSGDDVVAPSSRLTVTWRIMNSGGATWPLGCYLWVRDGQVETKDGGVPVPPLEPGREAEVSVEVLSPPVAGVYYSQFRMTTGDGVCFGDVIWLILTVEAEKRQDDMEQ